jgi:predicted lipoprotein with Yx(FWY)xxD motif
MRIPFTIGLVIVAVAFAACGGGGAASPTSVATTAAPAATPAATPAGTASAAPTEDDSPGATDGAGEITVDVAESDHGEILVDGEGVTLYGFTNDENGEPSCYDQCEQTWPPLTVEDESEIEVGEGLDDSDFTTVERTDGSMQVKIGDWPLYYFANDAAPGDTNGQGVGGVWFVVGADGELIR